MKTLMFLIAAAISVATIASSYAEVTFVDQNSDSNADSPAFTQDTVGPTSGIEGDFELLACATLNDGSNSFQSATPNWDFIQEGNCGDGNFVGCVLSFWNKFGPEPNNSNSTCIWSTPELAFAAGVFRYRGHDPINPLGILVCNSGHSLSAISPSIQTSPGSMVARFYIITNGGLNDQFDELPGSEEFGKFADTSFIVNPFAGITIFAYNEPTNGDTAAEVSISLAPVGSSDVPPDWRACTALIRMQSTDVPTLNEWGLLSFAVFAGLAGFWFIRKKSFAA